jgi:thiol:disulfide interchange protein DsbC
LYLSAYLKEDWKKKEKTKDYQCEEGKKLVEASMNLGKKLGVSGVPAFYLDNGKKVVGANIPQLKQILSNLTGKKGKGK